jgi:DNA-binding CsgD family transcriptional regulator/PAS domain-containing protein
VHLITLSTYSGLVEAIYEAGLDPKKWDAFLVRLSRSLNGVWIALHCHDHVANINVGMLSQHYDPDYAATYRRDYARINPWSRAARVAAVGRAQTSEELVDPRILRKSQFYNEWVRPQEDIGTGAGITLFRDAQRFVRLSANLRFRDAERMQGDLVALLNMLAPHLHRSLTLARRLRGRHFGADLIGVLDGLPDAVFLLDSRGRVLHANARAECLRGEGDFFGYDRAGRLVLNDPVADNAVSRALRAIAKSEYMDLPGLIIARGSRSGATAEATVAPIPSRWDSDDSDLRSWFQHEGPVAIVCLGRSGARHTPDPGNLSLRFDLTPAEAAISLALCDGETLRGHAERRGISIHTARKQLKSVFEKTGTGRQSQLVALLVGMGTSGHAARRTGPLLD